jgi:2,3-bisphosphoglycerate-dependent phosphoglycerate mutase
MTKLFILFIISLSSCATTNYYVVRHAEKEAASTNMMTTDVPLSQSGKERAEALKILLQNNNIQRIFSTNYIRTTSTVKPLSEAIGVPIEIYAPGDSLFINNIKEIKNRNILIVGHSNTVDDIVNGITGEKHLQDLPDTQYGDLFVIKKKGNKYKLELKKFGN